MKIGKNFMLLILLTILVILPIEVYGSLLTLTVSKFLKLSLLLFLTLAVFVLNQRSKLNFDAISIFQIFFLASTFTIVIFQEEPQSSILKWTQYLIVFLFYFAVIQPGLYKVGKYGLKKIENAIILVFVINLIISFLQIHYNFLWPSSSFQLITDFSRPVGLFNNSNGLGGYFVIIAMYFLWGVLNYKDKKYYFYLALSIYGLIISGSEGSQISFIVGSIVVLSSCNNYTFRVVRGISMFASIIFFLSIVLSDKVQAFATSILEQQARYDLWFLTWQIFKDNWLVGIGNYTFFDKISEYGFIAKYGAVHPHPHNIILDFLVSYGILGFLLIFMIVIYVVVKYITYNPSEDLEYTKIMVIAYFIQAMIHDMVDGGFLIGTSSVAIFQLFMFAYFLYYIPSNENESKKSVK